MLPVLGRALAVPYRFRSQERRPALRLDSWAEEAPEFSPGRLSTDAPFAILSLI
jgi:hypothetical protein